MLLSPMRYKEYVWPHNPTVYAIRYERPVAVHKVPFGKYYAQDLGRTCRVLRGEGAFCGADAYQEFKRLATVFYDDGPGLLIHPVWQISNAYFTSLTLAQEPLPDYVRYTFSFTESYDGYSDSLTDLGASEGDGQDGTSGQAVTHTLASGETLWGLSQRCGAPLETILAANPGIRNPNLVQAGLKVVIPC